MLPALGELGWLHSRAVSAGVEPQPVPMSHSAPSLFTQMFLAGGSVCSLLTGSSGRISPEIVGFLFGCFYQV